MAKREIRVYVVEQSIFYHHNGRDIDIYMPDLSAVPSLVNSVHSNSVDWWKPITSSDHTDGIFNSYFVGVYTTISKHELLEAESHITRIDTLDRAAKEALIAIHNPDITYNQLIKLERN